MARGRVFRKPSGSYAYRVDVGLDPASGKRRQLQKSGFRTKAEASKALQEVLQSIADGSAVNRSSMSVASYFDEWMIGQRQRLKATTFASYLVAVNRITDHLGERRLKALTALEVESFYALLAESGSRAGKPLSAKSVRNTHVVLRKAMSDAERLGLVARNPVASARPPVVRRKEFQTWSGEEVRRFLDSVSDERLFVAYLMFATTGMRRGEVLGLRWSDVDLHRSQLAVVQTLTTVEYRPIFTTPKTKRSRRVVYLDAGTIAGLEAHRGRQQVERRAAGPDWCDEMDLIFRDEFGRPLNPDWFSVEFGRVCRGSGLPKIRLHDLRHTHATLALMAGVHPKVVSERLGHSSIGVTLDLYSHVTPALSRDAAESVAKEIFGTI